MLVYENCLLEKFLSLLPYLESSGVDWCRNVVDVPLASKESKLQVLTGIISSWSLLLPLAKLHFLIVL